MLRLQVGGLYSPLLMHLFFCKSLWALTHLSPTWLLNPSPCTLICGSGMCYLVALPDSVLGKESFSFSRLPLLWHVI